MKKRKYYDDDGNFTGSSDSLGNDYDEKDNRTYGFRTEDGKHFNSDLEETGHDSQGNTYDNFNYYTGTYSEGDD